MKTQDMLIKVGINAGEEIFNKILEQYPELDDSDVRQTAVVQSLLIECICYMYYSGTSQKFLHATVEFWCRRCDEENDE